MNKIFALCWIAILGLSLQSCVVAIGTGEHDKYNDWEDRQEENLEYINALEINRMRQDVIQDLGSPDFREAFTQNGDAYVVLYYRTNWVHGDGTTNKDETTPLVFINDRLTGWGDVALKALEE